MTRSMTVPQGRPVAEVTQEPEPDSAQAFMERLASALHEFNVPAGVLERLQQAATAAVSRAFQHGTARAACVSVSTRSIQREDGRIRESWGFFLVEHGAGDGAPYQVSV